ncbi:inosine-5-monophosphate dehydrogenase [Tateyamaria omphalii]|uniref:CBS domain-containing protein n=1 Tax=Tateyamaria omphalii TaxID=299262 RepID=UPI0016798DEB|nr:CBS domain-containing protein [Tateyamaria omphalii]GGX42725.1 inosine-5-monophosphate dehydrogenase [Tateyamaria omphalii]
MPASYQAPMVGDKAKDKHASQSVSSNMTTETARVDHLLQNKGRDAIAIVETDTIATAVGILRDKRIGALIVVDSNQALAGILSERDIVRKLAETPGQTLPQTVAENMTRDVVTCEPDDTLIKVLRQMSEGHFRHMPVVKGGKLMGMITIGDVINFRLNELEHEALQLKQLIVG